MDFQVQFLLSFLYFDSYLQFAILDSKIPI